jgi:hypothetical protein
MTSRHKYTVEEAFEFAKQYSRIDPELVGQILLLVFEDRDTAHVGAMNGSDGSWSKTVLNTQAPILNIVCPIPIRGKWTAWLRQFDRNYWDRKQKQEKSDMQIAKDCYKQLISVSA